MATLDTRPEVVDVHHYGGDTLTLKVTAGAALGAAAMQWDAQVKSTRAVDTVDATFIITLPPADGDPAYLTLPAAVVAALVEGAPTVTRRDARGVTRTIAQYTGDWDCQISNEGSDPVRTLAQGQLMIDLDVTRLLP
jgi:hypothetical protein